MNSTNNYSSGEMKTGIIFFSRSRNCEARNKKWHSSHTKNLEIAHHLIERTKSVLANAEHDVILIDETKQRGQTFGEKIRFAFEDTYQLGYDRLILVGNDSLGLSEKYVTESIDFLSENSFVFGATEDNGLYLIGFERDFFNHKSEKIASLPWLTNRLVGEFSKLTNFKGISILPILKDLNTVEDIKQLLRSGFDAFSEAIRVIIHGISIVLKRNKVSLSLNVEYARIKKRGPPNFLLQ
ncbi:MAG: DUF2064 domain-containing protein [Crocinitomicaceae bacterium]